MHTQTPAPADLGVGAWVGHGPFTTVQNVPRLFNNMKNANKPKSSAAFKSF